jgi:hypothetical protein
VFATGSYKANELVLLPLSTDVKLEPREKNADGKEWFPADDWLFVGTFTDGAKDRKTWLAPQLAMPAKSSESDTAKPRDAKQPCMEAFWLLHLSPIAPS